MTIMICGESGLGKTTFIREPHPFSATIFCTFRQLAREASVHNFPGYLMECLPFGDAENLFASYAQDPNLRVAGVSGPTSKEVPLPSLHGTLRLDAPACCAFPRRKTQTSRHAYRTLPICRCLPTTRSSCAPQLMWRTRRPRHGTTMQSR